jgi:hypothetical protein
VNIKPHFSGHETFPVRYTWPKKSVDATRADPGIFSADDALVRLGVGKNMVKSIRHWGLATGVLEEDPGSRGRLIKPSEFGLRLFDDDGWDPYLEDPATIWLLHWNLAAHPGRATTWYWLFNLHPTPEFTVEDVVQCLIRLAREKDWPKLTPNSLRRDVDCCVRTYYSGRKSARAVVEDTLDCPLAELRLIRPAVAKGSYVLTREPRPTLPPGIFAFALAEYMRGTGLSSMSLDDLLYQPGAPGRVFGLDEGGLIRCVEGASEQVRELTYDETAGLKQIRISGKINQLTVLSATYRRRTSKLKRSVA